VFKSRTALHYIIKVSAKNFIKCKFETIDQPRAKNLTLDLFQRLAKRLSLTLQGAIVVVQAKLLLAKGSSLLHLAEVVTDPWIILFSLLSLFTFLDILQTVKLVASILTCILAVSLLMDRSPLILLSGLGALSAVML
jgi:miniconductance mechanosensitive channel